jgi:Single-stranded DNA binding protein, SSDP
MPSPQDSSNSGGENMYTIMKPVVPGGNIGGDFSMGGGGSDGSQMGPMGGVLNGDGLDGMKNSPANGSSGGGGGGGGPGTPRDDSGSGMGDYNLGGFGGGGENVRNVSEFFLQWYLKKQSRIILQDQTESAAILKIKESMQEEAKRFEKDNDQPDYYMQ